VVCLDRRVAFAGRLSETVEIDDFDMAAAVMNMVSLLQRAGSQRDAVAPRADHLRKLLLP